MYKTQLFSAEKIELLQHAINDWLKGNKDILIHNSNLSQNNAKGVNEYVFFILYAATHAETEELKELAATVTGDQSVEVKEINPEILKPTS